MVTPTEGFKAVSAICIHFTPFTTVKPGKMAQKVIDMNRIRQVQQLRDDGVAIKEIVRRTGVSRKISTVGLMISILLNPNLICRYRTMVPPRTVLW